MVEEDELYEEDDSDSDESDYLGDVSSVDVVVHRVTWTRGEKVRESNSPETTFKGSWETFLTSAVGKDTEQDYECAFNRLFAMESPEKATKEDGALGIDELLGLFSQSSPTKGATSTPKEKRSPVDFSALTQRGRGLAETIQDQIISNSDKLSILESTCPQWRENVAFAMKQKDDGDVEVALENVRKSKQRLEKMKESFLGAWQQQQTVLDVYELSLNESLKRLSSSSTSSDETTETETEVSPDDDASSVRYRKAAVK